jgi:hypothetical protein
MDEAQEIARKNLVVAEAGFRLEKSRRSGIIGGRVP